MNTMKIAAISDLHGFLIDIEECDIVCICGDITPLDIQHDLRKSREWLLEIFVPWANKLPCKQVYLVGGNHDKYLSTIYGNHSERYKLFTKTSDHKICLLDNESTVFFHDNKEYTIFGTPFCKIFGNWSYMKEDYLLKDLYSKMPYNCDIVLTHDAPDIGDVGTILDRNKERVGNKVLADEINIKKPKLVCCGHIHSGAHNMQEIEGINIVNVSIVNEQYKQTNKPFYYNV